MTTTSDEDYSTKMLVHTKHAEMRNWQKQRAPALLKSRIIREAPHTTSQRPKSSVIVSWWRDVVPHAMCGVAQRWNARLLFCASRTGWNCCVRNGLNEQRREKTGILLSATYNMLLCTYGAVMQMIRCTLNREHATATRNTFFDRERYSFASSAQHRSCASCVFMPGVGIHLQCMRRWVRWVRKHKTRYALIFHFCGKHWRVCISGVWITRAHVGEQVV